MSKERKITWLHLSDFHVGMDGYGQRKLFSEIVSYVSDQVSDGYHFDFVFFTGDIANKGLSDEYHEFLDAFLMPLVDILGSTWTGHMFGVPGNHDIDRRWNPHFTPSDILGQSSPL